MNRAAALLFALGSAAAALAGCIAAPATGDDTGESQEALDRSLVVTPVDKTEVVQPSASTLAESKLAASVDKPVPARWTSPYAKSCAPYDAYTAALAEYTIACTGTIGPESFVVESGILRRTFDRCIARGSLLDVTLRDIDDLLKLQEPQYEKDIPRNPDGSAGMTIRECFVKPWTAWIAENFPTGTMNPCPDWIQLTVDPTSDVPTADGVAQFSKKLPKPTEKGVIEMPPAAAARVQTPKENFYYAVRYPLTLAAEAQRKCGTVESCGNLCTNGLEGFYVDTKRVNVRLPSQGLFVKEPTFQGLAIVGDPLWWLDPTSYAAGCNPYSAADYYHPMSFYRALPGARYGHRNRIGEKCSYWADPYHMIGQLIGDCVDPTDLSTCTMSHCDPTPITTPGPSSGAAGGGSPTP
jgi:hypothetical protein